MLGEKPDLKIEVIPTLHRLPEAIASREQRRDLLFVGGFSHTPNVDAVLYFCGEIFPLIQTRLSDLKVHIVGNAPSAEIIALATDDVIVDGYVPNLAPYLESALISIAPLRYGAGMKGKIAEAMAHGVPVVTTTIGAEGMNLRDGVDALIAETAVSFADSVIRLHQDPLLWESLSRNGRIRVEREWSPNAVDARLVSLLESARRPRDRAMAR